MLYIVHRIYFKAASAGRGAGMEYRSTEDLGIKQVVQGERGEDKAEIRGGRMQARAVGPQFP